MYAPTIKNCNNSLKKNKNTIFIEVICSPNRELNEKKMNFSFFFPDHNCPLCSSQNKFTATGHSSGRSSKPIFCVN